MITEECARWAMWGAGVIASILIAVVMAVIAARRAAACRHLRELEIKRSALRKHGSRSYESWVDLSLSMNDMAIVFADSPPVMSCIGRVQRAVASGDADGIAEALSKFSQAASEDAESPVAVTAIVSVEYTDKSRSDVSYYVSGEPQ